MAPGGWPLPFPQSAIAANPVAPSRPGIVSGTHMPRMLYFAMLCSALCASTIFLHPAQNLVASPLFLNRQKATVPGRLGNAGGAVSAIDRACAIYCTGNLLSTVQALRIFADSKHFVDMPMRVDPEEILAAFEALPPAVLVDAGSITAFVERYFDKPGSELVPFTPLDWSPTPPLDAHVADLALREFLKALHDLWPTLIRVVAPQVAQAPQRHSALPRRFPMVLPGGRFREMYYWDSLWIVEGLLVSGMVDTAHGLVQNLLDDVTAFGYIPNGGRIYYLNRSQPPLLCEMVASVARAMGVAAAEWLAAAVPTLQREYNWWMGGKHAVSVEGVKLNRFFADWHDPRPESYREDVELADGDAKVYQEIASAAETGWDFSSRWTWEGGQVGGRFSLREVETTRILPVDLNAILFRAEVTLAALSEAVHTKTPFPDVEVALRSGKVATSASATALLKAAADRRKIMNKVLWQPRLSRWVDAWLPATATANFSHGEASMAARSTTIADFAAPLWAGLVTPEHASSVVVALKASGLLGVGGTSTTTVLGSGQQWDAPNAWAPLQSMLIKGLRQLDASSGGPELAAELAQQWVNTCYAAWNRTGLMYEKYNSSLFGSGGGGGEYIPQVGFGWSNGAVLELLRDYGEVLVRPNVSSAMVIHST